METERHYLVDDSGSEATIDGCAGLGFSVCIVRSDGQVITGYKRSYARARKLVDDNGTNWVYTRCVAFNCDETVADVESDWHKQMRERYAEEFAEDGDIDD